MSIVKTFVHPCALVHCCARRHFVNIQYFSLFYFVFTIIKTLYLDLHPVILEKTIFPSVFVSLCQHCFLSVGIILEASPLLRLKSERVKSLNWYFWIFIKVGLMVWNLLFFLSFVWLAWLLNLPKIRPKFRSVNPSSGLHRFQNDTFS